MVVRVVSILFVACVAVMPARAAAPAGSFAVSFARDRFVPRVVVQQGGSLSLVQADPLARHDLQSMWHGLDRLPLFTTGPDLIDFGEIAEVRGVPLLEPSTYPFHCIEHPGMYGQLIVV